MYYSLQAKVKGKSVRVMVHRKESSKAQKSQAKTFVLFVLLCAWRISCGNS
jgi:hypothetical protein